MTTVKTALNFHATWRLEFAQQLSQIIRQTPGVRAIVVGGSVARGYADRYSDVEIPIFWEALPTDAVRHSLIAALQADMLYPYNGPAQEDNLLIQGLQIDLWHKTVAEEETVFNDVLLRHDTHLGDSNFFDTIRTCIPLYGGSLIHRWKQRAQEYPDALVEKHLYEQLAAVDVTHLALHAVRENPTLVYQGIIALQQRIFLLLLALNRQYFPSYKWMYETLRSLPVAPSQIAQRFRYLFTMSLTDAVDEILRILDETCACIHAQYPHIKADAVKQGGVLIRTAHQQPVRVASSSSLSGDARSAENKLERPQQPDARKEGSAANSGTYPAIVEHDPALPTHTIYRPQILDAFGTTAWLPIVAWGNGGCMNSSFPFRNFLLEIASHGFLVLAIGDADKPTTERAGGTTQASQLLDAIDWAIAEHTRPESRYAGKLATDKIAVMGQSCGGLQALAVSHDPRITTSVIWNSGLLTAPPPPHLPVPHIEKTVLRDLHAPIAYFNGGVEDIAYVNALDDVARIDHVPLFFGSIDVGHGGTFAEPHGGEFARVGAAWLKWHLMDDQAAGSLFAGADCALCTDARWQVIKKQML